MTSRRRILLLLTAASAAAVIFFLLVTLPPAAEHLPAFGDAELERRTIPGAFHIHTRRSDGTADQPAVAAAAARAGLQFAIFTDHGDGTRPPDPPAYINGVLCLDGVELATDSGHYLAVDLPRSPYPLGGAGSSVVEDVARLGGFGVTAHPDSPKPALRWRDSVAVDAIEWLNADSEWRDEGRLRLARALVDYLVRPGAALAGLLDRPAATLSRWDAATRARAVVALAGHDAHGGIGGAIEDGERLWIARVPSYEAAFRSMSTRLIVDEPLTGDPSRDATLILNAMRRGRAFTAIDAVARPAVLDFRVRSEGRDLTMGESGPFVSGAVVAVRAAVPSGAQTVLLHDGREVAVVSGGRLRHSIDTPGAYRVEVRAPRAPGNPPVPWLLTNPIYLRAAVPPDRSAAAPPQVVLALDGGSWHVEHDPGSRGTLSWQQNTLRTDYELKSGERTSQFVALAAELPADVPAFDTIVFTGRASGPMRVSVQLRFRGDDERWVRSVYLEGDARAAHVRVADMLPAGAAGRTRPDRRQAIGILFVVDLTNAAPGMAGWFAIHAPALALQNATSSP